MLRCICSIAVILHRSSLLFSFHDPATTEIYTLSLHDALPISMRSSRRSRAPARCPCPSTRIWRRPTTRARVVGRRQIRSEEHTSELQSQSKLVCRLLLEKKKKQKKPQHSSHQQKHNH